MGLPRSQSIAVGLGLMGLTWAIYSQTCPRVADLRVGKESDSDASGAEKTARWTSGAVVIGVSAITQDATVFIMGGLMVIALSWQHRHANWLQPGVAGGYAPTAPNIHTGDGLPVGTTTRM